MYLGILDKSEVEQIVQALRGPQFDRKLHGGLFDRGSADSYYGRPRDPHWYPKGSYRGTRVEAEQMDDEETEAYHAGYDYNEQFGHKKDWG